MPAATDSISTFLKKYHLWSLVLFLSLLGLRDAASFAIWSWYRLLDEVSEASYTHKIHNAENRRHYEQAARYTQK